MPSLRRRIANSRFAGLAAFPTRLHAVTSHNARTLGRSARWLATSREHTNFTYDLTDLNLEHLAWFVGDVADTPVEEMRDYIRELHNDTALQSHVRERTAESSRRGLADPQARWHKRLGWYALIRAVRPAHVVETGTDKGLGSCVIAAALLRNGSGKLTTIDVNHDSGYLIAGQYSQVIDRVLGDSVDVIRGLPDIDFLLHDSLHTHAHETAEYDAALARLTPRAMLLSDNAHVTTALPEWAERTGRRFSFWHEIPKNHWYPGEGIGIAAPAKTRIDDI